MIRRVTDLYHWGLRQEFLRYAASGAVAFVADISVFLYLTTTVGIDYLISNVVGFSAGLIVSYIINVKWVFHHRVYSGATRKEMIIFVGIVLTALAISEAGLYLLIDGSDIEGIIAGLVAQIAPEADAGNLYLVVAKSISLVFVFLFNYFAKKYILFTPRQAAAVAR